MLRDALRGGGRHLLLLGRLSPRAALHAPGNAFAAGLKICKACIVTVCLLSPEILPAFDHLTAVN